MDIDPLLDDSSKHNNWNYFRKTLAYELWGKCISLMTLKVLNLPVLLFYSLCLKFSITLVKIKISTTQIFYADLHKVFDKIGSKFSQM